MSWLFARDRPDEDPRPRPRWVKPVHRTSAVVIVAAMLYMLANAIWHFDRHAAYYGETAATVAFGVSWLVKAGEMLRRVSAERERGRRRRRREGPHNRVTRAAVP